MAKYLSIEFGSGQLFEYSSTPKEGFVEYKSSKGSVSYRGYERKGVLGELLNVSIRNGRFGDELQFAQKTADGTVVISSMGLYDQQGNVDQAFAEPLIRLLGNLKKGETYKFLPYTMSAADQENYDKTTEGREVAKNYYDRRGISIKLEDGTKVEPYLHYKTDDESVLIPKVVWKDHPTNPGKQKPSAASLEVKTDFLIAKLKEAIEGGLEYENTSNQTTANSSVNESKPEPKTGEKLPEKEAEEEYDDLPF